MYNLSRGDTSEFIDIVLEYGKEHGRHDLPFRVNPTPYGVLVSELMLQQTQVARVIPKWEKWMEVYPTLAALRMASLQDVLTLWKGLGYERRAKYLLGIARTYTELPVGHKELLACKGIGLYTAAAVMAFAHNEFVPVLDTNIKAALLHHFYTDADGLISDAEFYQVLTALENDKEVQAVGARVWYLSLMDYGAYIKQADSYTRQMKSYTKQSKFEGSPRQLRASVLHTIRNGESLPEDMRVPEALAALIKDGMIVARDGTYVIAD